MDNTVLYLHLPLNNVDLEKLWPMTISLDVFYATKLQIKKLARNSATVDHLASYRALRLEKKEVGGRNGVILVSTSLTLPL